MPYESIEPFRISLAAEGQKKAPRRVRRRFQIQKRVAANGESDTSPMVARFGARIKWILAKKAKSSIYFYCHKEENMATYELDDSDVLDSGLNVNLQKNTLLDDGSLFARVVNRTATVKGALSSIKEDGMSEKEVSLMRHYLKVYEAKLLQLLEMGYAVKVMDLGTLRIKHSGSIATTAEGQALSNFTVAFTPTDKTKEAVAEIACDTASVPDYSPSLEVVTDLASGAENSSVTPGGAVRVTGSRLKIGETADDTLYFVPQTSAGADEPDTSQWIAVDSSSIFRNKPTELNFFAPTSLSSGASYRIRVSTTYAGGSSARKEPLVGESEVITAL